MSDINYKDLDKHKKVLRKTNVDMGNGRELKREKLQAEEFVSMHKKAELNKVLSAFETETMADLLDFLVLDELMLEKGSRYRDFKTDIVDFVKMIKAESKRK